MQTLNFSNTVCYNCLLNWLIVNLYKEPSKERPGWTFATFALIRKKNIIYFYFQRLSRLSNSTDGLRLRSAAKFLAEVKGLHY
jgi:hypothetical protein